MSIEDIVAKLDAQTDAAEQAELQRMKTLLGLDDKKQAAQHYVDEVTRQEPEIDAAMQRTMIKRTHRERILQKRPGLLPYFEKVDDKQRELERVGYAERRKLRDAIPQVDRLTVADLTPSLPLEQWVPTAFGPISPKLWRLRDRLGNRPALADVATAIKNLDTAFAELSERMATVAASHQG